MEYTVYPDKEDSGNPAGLPAEAAKTGKVSTVDPFFVVNMIICGVLVLLIMIFFCVKIPCIRRQNSRVEVSRLEEALPLVRNSSFHSDNISMLQQQAQDKAAEGGQHSQEEEDVQGLPQAQEEAQEPGDGDVRKRPGVHHDPWNDSVVGDNESCETAAGSCDAVYHEYVNVKELQEELRASQERQRASACNEESDQQDGCTKEVYGSGEDTEENDDDSPKGASSSPSEPPRPPSASPKFEKENMTLVYFGIHSLGKAEEVLRAQRTREAAAHAMSGKS